MHQLLLTNRIFTIFTKKKTITYINHTYTLICIFSIFIHVQVKQTIEEEYAYPVPLHIRNAPTELMKVRLRIFFFIGIEQSKIDDSDLLYTIKEFGYGEGYKYNPDYEGPVYQNYLPPKIKNKVFLDVEKEKKVDLSFTNVEMKLANE